jgi:hypothetical protein
VGQLKAIEPSEGMRDVFSKTVKDDRVTVAEGGFDNTGIEDGWADLIVIAQVRFHHNITNDEADPSYSLRLSTGVQITIVLPRNLLVSLSQKVSSP